MKYILQTFIYSHYDAHLANKLENGKKNDRLPIVFRNEINNPTCN